MKKQTPASMFLAVIAMALFASCNEVAQETVFLSAESNQQCASGASAEKQLDANGYTAFSIETQTQSVIQAKRICWYRVLNVTSECLNSKPPPQMNSRADIVAFERNRGMTDSIDGLACEGERLIYGQAVLGDVEAACPPSIIPDAAAEQRQSPNVRFDSSGAPIRTDELVGTDFFEARIQCIYEGTYVRPTRHRVFPIN